MTYLIALVVMIALAAIIALISFTNIGSSFSDRQAKGEAQKLIQTANEIQAAFVAHSAIHGNSSFDDYEDLLTNLTAESRLLRDRVITDYEGNFNALSGETEGNGFLVITQNNEKVCQYINNQLHGTPLDAEILSCDSTNLTCCLNES